LTDAVFSLTIDLPRSCRKDSDDSFGVRGAGATWQAEFGMPLNEEDLLFSVRREPLANRVVFQVAHDIFDKWFRVEEVAEKPDPNFDREVQKVLSLLQAKSVFTEAVVYERLFGWAIIALTYVDYAKDVSKPVKGAKEILELLPYSSLQFSVQSSDEDKDPESPRFGLPISYTVRRAGLDQVKLHFSRTIHLATRLLDHPYRGMSVLEGIYDDLTVWRNVRWGLGQTIFRYGSGFPDITMKSTNPKKLEEFKASEEFKQIQARTYFVHGDDITLDFKGVAGRALDPAPYCNPIMESFSTGTGIPLAILRGAQAGALTGSEVNEHEYFKLVSDAQSRLEPGVRQLIDVLIACGQIQTKVKDYRIVWLGGFQVSDTEKATIELNLAQAREKKLSWMTVDEVRAEQGLQPLPNGAGQVVLGIERLNQQQFLEQESESAADSGFWSRLRRVIHGNEGKHLEDDSSKQS
jgi:phage-related protein (TIGR01555 family)